MSKLYIKAGRLIDGTGAPAKENMAITIEDGKITAIGPIATPPEGAEVCDCSGKTILPGMINCHVHVGSEAIGDPLGMPRDQMNHTDLVIAACRHLNAYLQSGVTYVRSMGSADCVDIEVRNAIKSGRLKGPGIVAAGRCITMTGGHGWKNGIEVDSPGEARKACRQMLKKGCDVVKIMATGGVMTDGVEPGSPQLTVEEMKAAVDEAHKAGRRTATHAQGNQGIRNAMAAGLDTIEHGCYLDEEIIAQMVERGTYLVPTLCAPHFIIEAGVEKGVPEYAVRKSKIVTDNHCRSFQMAYKAGVKIAMGTDAGTPYNFHERSAIELELMVKNGMSNMDAILSATKVAAECICIADNYGTLEVGKMADLIAVEKDPLADITALQDVAMVWKHGEKVKG